MSRVAILPLLVLGAVAIAWGKDVRAAKPRPPTRVVCIEVAGVAVRLLRDDEPRHAERAVEAVGGCATPLPAAGLPGEHLVSALLDDGTAFELRRVPKDPAVIGLATREALGRAGWKEDPASALARDRSPSLPAAAFDLPGDQARATIWIGGGERGVEPLLAVAITRGGAP